MFRKDNPLFIYNEIQGAGLHSFGQVELIQITIDELGTIIVGGRFHDYPLKIADTAIINHGSIDFFISKFDNDGNYNWAIQGGGALNDKSPAWHNHGT